MLKGESQLSQKRLRIRIALSSVASILATLGTGIAPIGGFPAQYFSFVVTFCHTNGPCQSLPIFLPGAFATDIVYWWVVFFLTQIVISNRENVSATKTFGFFESAT